MARRFGSRRVRIRAVNALAERADPSWLDGASAVVIGGSGSYSVHHPRSSRWVEPLRRIVDLLMTRSIPTFGVCFGHQLLGFHLGVSVETGPAHTENGTIGVESTSQGLVDPLFGPLGCRWAAHTGHTDGVVEVPAGATLLATASQVRTQAFRLEGKPFYTTQFHPDLTADEAGERWIRVQRERGCEPDGLVAGFDSGRDESTSLLGRFLDRFLG